MVTVKDCPLLLIKQQAAVLDSTVAGCCLAVSCPQISPVWYQIRADEAGAGFKLTGGHDVDQGWIAKLREPVNQVRACDPVSIYRYSYSYCSLSASWAQPHLTALWLLEQCNPLL